MFHVYLRMSRHASGGKCLHPPQHRRPRHPRPRNNLRHRQPLLTKSCQLRKAQLRSNPLGREFPGHHEWFDQRTSAPTTLQIPFAILRQLRLPLPRRTSMYALVGFCSASSSRSGLFVWLRQFCGPTNSKTDAQLHGIL